MQEENIPFDLAYHFVLHTHQSVFITGKAGTGKTTFLKKVVSDTTKKTAIAAPTGVAAINAGGVTLHSLFQLPFQPFLPVSKAEAWHRSLGYSDQKSLFATVHLNQNKIDVLKQLDTLIIDEVSMVRADMLDAIDALLKHHRNSPLPFGGLQMVFIGDLFQLPPVCKQEEWSVLQLYYHSPFFFDAQVLQNNPPVLIELNKVYRQKASQFLDVLNRIRANQSLTEDLAYLNEFYQPAFRPEADDAYITLTTHNEKAETTNRYRLKKITSKEYIYKAIVKGEFSERMFPVEPSLTLKVGAQIMFTKNDKGEQRRYYNGLLATVTKLEDETIEVTTLNGGDVIKVEREVWRNIRYLHDKETDKLDEDELGSFAQYPIRLAWAITIHKSQGLTFDRAIIDAGDSFASGQVYVALSRLTSIDKLVLLSKITPSSIRVDDRVCAYMETMESMESLQIVLKEQQKAFLAHTLSRSFDWEDWLHESEEIRMYAFERDLPEKPKVEKLWNDILQELQELSKVALRFMQEELHKKLIPQAPVIGYQPLQERVEKAVVYLEKEIDSKILEPLEEHIQTYSIKKKVKHYIQHVRLYKKYVMRHKDKLATAKAYADALVSGKSPKIIKQEEPIVEVKKQALAKGETYRISLNLFKGGKSIAEIAEARGIQPSTVEGHLIGFLESGEVNIDDLVPKEIRQKIENAIDEIGKLSLTAIRDYMNQEPSYGQIRAVLAYYKPSIT